MRNEVIKQISDNQAQIDFEIMDLEGLTALSADPAITDKERKIRRCYYYQVDKKAYLL